eukprot:gene9169-10868_t
MEVSDEDEDEIKTIQKILDKPYEFGFTTDIESETLGRGLTEDIVRQISAKKEEPEWMLEFRLKAFKKWLTMSEPTWSDNHYPKINYQDIVYYSEPKFKEKKESLDEVDPELLATFDKLGISLNEQKRLTNVAVDAVFDSVSIATTFRKELAEAGVIFCSISEAIKEYPDLIKKHLGSVVPVGDNYFTALNAAVFSDGSFCYIPKGVTSPMELSTYFRINAEEAGQFERTLIVAEEGSYVSYLEGCTAPAYDTNQLHAAVVELVTEKDAEIKYSTVQNWYAGNEEGVGGIYNFVTKRGLCKGDNSKISWTQVNPGCKGAKNNSQCDSMLIGDTAAANTYPYIQVREPSARVEHEASTSKIGEEQLFYMQQRGLDMEEAVGMIISGFCREVFNELPMEFAAEVNQLMSLKLEGSVG